ncbi:MAG: NAD(P)H-hydrate dehydratase [Limnochordaceae bacterium]|nr:NAD(P)H-hydrate dehydratase [Limnochordaceae bacterium]
MASMQEVDRRAAAEYGVPSMVLMENAGAAVARVASEMLGGSPAGRRVVVVAGPGNNGGDGLVAARRLANRGARVRVLLAAEQAGERPRLSPDALANYQIATRSGIEVVALASLGEDRAGELLATAQLIIDAVLGTGARGAPRGPAMAAIAAIERVSGAVPVLAVDIPSGVDADTGLVAGVAVRATRTVTFGLPKPGQLLFPGAALCGRIDVAEIGFPPALLEQAPPTFEILDARSVRAFLPARPADAHKGTFGHLLVVAGSRGMAGAGVLASRAAAAAGAGLVTWGLPRSLQDGAFGAVPEALTVGLSEGEEGRLGPASAGEILALQPSRDALVIGPGLGTHPLTRQAVLSVVGNWQKPLVVDADALNALAAEGAERWLRPDAGAAVQHPGRILTPHPGEMARLLGKTIGQIQEDRVTHALEAARRFGAVVVLKGARTMVAAPDGRLWLNPAASAALATGGSGDVLAGIAGSLLAQGVGAVEAALAAVYVHGLAGWMAAEGGSVGVTAAGIAARVGEAMRGLMRGEPVPEDLEPVRVLE